MKYRIKDPKKRKLIKELFDIEEINSGHTSTELRVDLSFAGHNFASNHLPVEKVQELAEGWHPYPDEKPEKADELYIVAWKNNGGSEYIDFSFFDGEVFDLQDSNIIAWREYPKIWKE